MQPEDNKSSATGTPVMDIQAPKPANPTADPASTEPMVGGPAVDSGAVTSAPITEALSGTEASDSSAPATPDTPMSMGGGDMSSPAASAPAGDAAATPAGGVVTPADGKPAKKKHGAPVAAIVVAIIVALGLIGVAVFAYMKSHEKKATPAAATTTQATSNSVSTQDVDSSSSNIDTNLKKIDEAKDFPTTDLSDTSLSLQ